jgi:hypothetical protein
VIVGLINATQKPKIIPKENKRREYIGFENISDDLITDLHLILHVELILH